MRAAQRVMHKASAGASPLAGYTAWYDASQISGVSDGASLSSWADLSANGYNLSQPTGADQPTYYKTTAAKLINGLPAVWFDGTDDVMTDSGFPAPVAASIFIVVATSTPSATQVFLELGSSGVDLYCTSSQYTMGGTVTGGTVDTNPHVVAGVTSGTAAGLYIDGAQKATGTTGGGTGGLSVGAFFSPSFWLTGAIAELLIYSSAFSGTNLTTNNAYLKTKWGTP